MWGRGLFILLRETHTVVNTPHWGIEGDLFIEGGWGETFKAKMFTSGTLL